MHISEGVLSAPVLAAGAVFSAIGIGYGLKRTDYDRIPKVAVMSSTFFVASLIHVPVGPSSVHLILNGIVGLLLGWSAFPAIFAALVLQAILFQFGGITTLGVNTFNAAFPSIICFYLFGCLVRRKNSLISLGSAFACGFLAIFISGLLVAVSLIFTEESFIGVAKLVIIAHFPVMLIEGIISVFCVGFLRKVRPEILEVSCEKR